MSEGARASDASKVHLWRRGVAADLDARVLFASLRSRMGFPSAPDVVDGFAVAAAAAVARYAEGQDVRPLDVETEAVAAAVIRARDRGALDRGLVADLVDLWCATEGAPFAMRALLRAGELDGVAWRTDADSLREARFVRLATHWALRAGFVGPWRRLRERLLTSTDDAYRVARDEADRVRRNTSDAATRAALAYAFPLEPSWAHEEALREPEDDGLVPGHRHALLASVADLEVAAKLVASAPSHTLPYLPTVVDRLGAPCASWLVEIGTRAAPHHRLAVLDAVSVLSGRARADVAVALAMDPPTAELALRLLEAEPEHGLAALATRAAGDRPARARAMLRTFVAGHPELPMRVAAELGPEALAELAPWVEASWLLPRPRRRAAREGKWLRPDELGEVRRADGGKVEVADIAQVVSALERGRTDVAVDRDDLAAIASAVVEQWSRAGAPAEGAWCLRALAATESPDAARTLGTLTRRWAFEKHDRAAVLACTALASMQGLASLGTLARLDGLAGPVGTRVQAELAARLSQNGISAEDVSDVALAELALGPGGWVSYGPRRFRISLDDRLDVRLTDEQGRTLRALPRPTKGDEPERVSVAEHRWEEARVRVPAIVETMTERLERAMCTRRQWSVDHFRQCLLDDPILIELVRRLVWRTDEGATFRVDEEGHWLDCDDRELPRLGPVLVAHPIDVPERLREVWGEVFARYKVIQPFEQLLRRVHGEVTQTTLQRLVGMRVNPKSLDGLERSGWEVHHSLLWWRRSRVDVRVSFAVVDADEWELEDVVAIQIEKLTPLERSELFHDLESLSL